MWTFQIEEHIISKRKTEKVGDRTLSTTGAVFTESNPLLCFLAIALLLEQSFKALAASCFITYVISYMRL